VPPHLTAAKGFGRAADVYERGRPDYPAGAVAWMAAKLDLDGTSEVLDLGAGTGKLARALTRTGAHVIAVEPVSQMRSLLTASSPSVDVRDGVAEAIPLPDGSVDSVTVGQAFHWFERGRALAEIHRVLRPGGRLALVWNVRDLRDPLQGAIERVLRPHRGGAPSHVASRDPLAGGRFFRFVELHQERCRQPASARQVVDRVASVSFIAALDQAERDRVLAEVRRIIDLHRGDRFLAYLTEIYLYARVDRPGG
jgi:SAM-dependent methyltransferase